MSVCARAQIDKVSTPYQIQELSRIMDGSGTPGTKVEPGEGLGSDTADGARSSPNTTTQALDILAFWEVLSVKR